MKKYEVTASTIVYAEDDVNALAEGIRVFKNISTELIYDLSKVKLHVKPIDEKKE